MTATFRGDPLDESACAVGDSPMASGGLVLVAVVVMVAGEDGESRTDVALKVPEGLAKITSVCEREEVWKVEEDKAEGDPGNRVEDDTEGGAGASGVLVDEELCVGVGDGGGSNGVDGCEGDIKVLIGNLVLCDGGAPDGCTSVVVGSVGSGADSGGLGGGFDGGGSGEAIEVCVAGLLREGSDNEAGSIG